MSDSEHAENLVLRPSKRKWVLVAIGSFLFTALGFFLMPEVGLFGWVLVLFFGACFIVAVLGFVPGASYLKLMPDGFVHCSLWRKNRFRWRDVKDFHVIYMRGHPMIVFDVSGLERVSIMAGLSRFVSGADAALSDTYGLKADDLAKLMNDWKAKFG